MKTKKILLAIFASLALILAPVVLAAGVNIHQAAEQAGLVDSTKEDGEVTAIRCPVGVANCDESEETKENGEDKFSTEGVKKTALEIVGNALDFAAIIAVVMLVVGGVRLVVAGGDSDSLGAAKKHLLWTLGGLFVIILSMLIVRNITEIVYEVAPRAENSKEAASSEGVSGYICQSSASTSSAEDAPALLVQK